MTSISTLRQIVTDMHLVAPQGLRKVARAELAEKIDKPSGVFAVWANRQQFLIPETHGYRCSESSYPRTSVSNYLSKIYYKEQNMIIKKTIRNFGVEIKNETNYKIDEYATFNILQGLTVSKKAGLKLPKNVILETMEDCAGYFKPLKPKNIYIDPSESKLCSTVIHETTHKKDKFPRIISFVPIFGGLQIFGNGLILRLNKKLIKNEICEYATTNRNEFVACTAEKLLGEGKQWTDFDPKIKKLYDMFMGPKLKLGQK